MPDVVLTITIPDAKVATAKQGYLEVHPNTEKDINNNLIYTDNAWIKESIRRYIRDEVRRGLQIISDRNNQVAKDDGIATV